jgi:flagellar motor switch protein FliM
MQTTVSNPEATDTTANAPRKRRGQPKLYDFRRQSTLSRDHVRTMQIVQETFARGFTTMLASQLRSVTQVSITSIEQRSYDEYVRWLPNPTLLTLLGLAPLSGAAIFQIPLEICFSAIETMMGGTGDGNQPERPLTDLELVLMRGIIENTLPELRYAFEPVVATEPKIMSQESNPQYAQIAAPTDMVIVVAYEIKIDTTVGIASLCIPFSSLQPHLEALSASSLYGNLSSSNRVENQNRLRMHLGETSVEVAAQFRDLDVLARHIVGLQVGDVLPLHHPLDQPLTLVVDQTAVHHARIGRQNRHLAVLVDRPVDPLETRAPSRWSPTDERFPRTH